MKNDLLSLLIREFSTDGTISETERIILEKQAREIGFPINKLDKFIEDELAGNNEISEEESEYKSCLESSLAKLLLQPEASITKIQYVDESRKLPDLICIGTLFHKNNELNLTIPALIPFFNTKGVLIKFTPNSAKAPEKIIETLVFRLVLSIPNKLIQMNIIDESQGDRLRNIITLPEKIVGNEIAYDEQQINIKLKELLKISEQNRSKYLTSKYSSLAVYNDNNKQNQQPYNLLVINDFPNGFNKNSCDALLKLIKNGPPSGIYSIISYNTQATVPYDVEIDKFLGLHTEIDLTVNSTDYISFYNQFEGTDYLIENYKLFFDDTLPDEIDDICNKLREDLDKKEVLKIDIYELVSSISWTNSSSEGVRIPIGKTPEGKIIDFTLGHESGVYHALIGGASGSGKTVLLHDIIINGAKMYSPNELQFVLMDYKEGTEFKVYEEFPHVKILSIASNPEFGASVFEHLMNEIEVRGKLFKEQNVSNISDYRKTKENVLPRILMIIDEFQVLLSCGGKTENNIRAMMEDLSRRGRSFGIHLILSTQSLANVDISQSTLSQIGLRIALKMLDNDCTKILGVNNDAPVYFTNPGEAIYNTRNGLKEGNIKFQAANIENDTLKEMIKIIIKEQNNINLPLIKPFVFNGNQDACVKNNPLIAEMKYDQGKQFFDVFIGEPSIYKEGHVFYRLRKQTASNVLIVGEDSNATISIIKNSVNQLIKQCSEDSNYYICSFFPSDSGMNEHLDSLSEKSDNCTIIHNIQEIEPLFDTIIAELDQRIENQNTDTLVFLTVANANMVRTLKKDGYSLSPLTEKLIRIIKEGPDYGIHVLFHAVSYHTLMEIIEIFHLNEFEIKIALKGENSIKLFDEFLMEPIRNTNDALIKSPWCKYDVDKLKIYSK